MRFIDLEQIRPRIAHLLPALASAHQAVVSAKDAAARAKAIEANQACWTAFRTEFEKESWGRCWYVQCSNPGSDEDIDHFRPKLSVAEDPAHTGYYWLAFEWTNYRLSCHRANRPRKDPKTKTTGGKGDHFPLVDPAKRARTPSADLSEEVPALLDPTNPLDPPLLTFRANGEIDISPEHKGNSVAEAKIAASRIYLNLDWPKFTEARLMLYNKISQTIDRGHRVAPKDYSSINKAQPSFLDAIRDLVRWTKPQEDYSAAARVYIESFQHVWWIRQVVLKLVK